jgi:hypothetical protein
MISRGLFAIKLGLLVLIVWQLSQGCAWARHTAAASSNTASSTNSSSSLSGEDSELTQLEQQLFQHDYSTDPPSQRLERLEKMVFGNVNSGTDTERLLALKAATTASPLEQNPNSSPQNTASSPPRASNSTPKPSRRRAADTPQETTDQTPYPSVTAIEKKLFGKDYSSDAITKRLERLELKEFGKISDSDDLSERMDKLKQATGIDIAKQQPAGSDWVDEDELSFTDAPGVGKVTPFTPDAVEDGSDINNFIGGGSMPIDRPGFGSRGMGSMGGGMPHTTPLTARPPTGMGLSQEVIGLEKEVFGKTYTKDPLPARVTRLEAAIFPEEKPATDQSLPDRVSRLLTVIPLSGGDSQQADASTVQGQSNKQHGSKLSKLLGNMLGFTGSYPGSGSGNLTMDPQTGLLYNNSTGQLIDPNTGAVVGQQRTMGSNMGGMSPWGFGSGMSPFGTMPYGMGGMSGMGFGAGRMGMGGFGGMWP